MSVFEVARKFQFCRFAGGRTNKIRVLISQSNRDPVIVSNSGSSVSRIAFCCNISSPRSLQLLKGSTAVHSLLSCIMSSAANGLELFKNPPRPTAEEEEEGEDGGNVFTFPTLTHLWSFLSLRKERLLPPQKFTLSPSSNLNRLKLKPWKRMSSCSLKCILPDSACLYKPLTY